MAELRLRLSAIILASGYSKRYGRENKLMSDYHGRPLMEHVVDTVVQSQLFSKVVIVTQYSEIQRYYRAASKGIEIVMNAQAEEGISKSIELGVLASETSNGDKSEDIHGYVFLPADQPLISQVTIARLVTAFKGNREKIIVPVYGGNYGSPKIFPKRYKKALLALTGDVGGKQLIQRHSEDVLEVAIEREYELVDIDSKEDFKELEKKA